MVGRKRDCPLGRPLHSGMQRSAAGPCVPKAGRVGLGSIRSKTNSRIISAKRRWLPTSPRAHQVQTQSLAQPADFHVEIVDDFHVLADEADRRQDHVAARPLSAASAERIGHVGFEPGPAPAARCDSDTPAATRRDPAAPTPAGRPPQAAAGRNNCKSSTGERCAPCRPAARRCGARRESLPTRPRRDRPWPR